MDFVARVVDFVKAAAADFKSLNQTISSKVDKVEGKALSTEDYSTADKAKVAAIQDVGGQNLLYNSAMRLISVGGIADGWKLDVPAAPGASTGVLSIVPSPINLDENAQRLTVAGLNTSTLYRSLMNDPAYPTPKVGEGMNITVSTFVKGTAGLGARLYIQALSSAGVVLGTVYNGMTTLDGTVQRINKTYNNLPAGTVKLQVLYRVYAVTATAGVVDFARPAVQVGQLGGWTEDTRSTIGAWINLPLLTGFTAVAANPPQYRKVGDKVELRGKVTMGAKVLSGGSYPFATLPLGHLPAGTTSDTETINFSVICTSSITTVCACSVNRVGQCAIVLGGALSLATSTYDLASVKFSTAA